MIINPSLLLLLFTIFLISSHSAVTYADTCPNYATDPPDCYTCDVKFEQGYCLDCNNDYGYYGVPPNCIDCATEYCFVAGTITTGGSGSNCTCVCRNAFRGAKCDICPENFVQGGTCGQCESGYTLYPAGAPTSTSICSKLCTSADCSYAGTPASSDTHAAGCLTCTCSTNKDPATHCATCLKGFDRGANCARTITPVFDQSLTKTIAKVTTSLSRVGTTSRSSVLTPSHTFPKNSFTKTLLKSKSLTLLYTPTFAQKAIKPTASFSETLIVSPSLTQITTLSKRYLSYTRQAIKLKTLSTSLTPLATLLTINFSESKTQGKDCTEAQGLCSEILIRGGQVTMDICFDSFKENSSITTIPTSTLISNPNIVFRSRTVRPKVGGESSPSSCARPWVSPRHHYLRMAQCNSPKSDAKSTKHHHSQIVFGHNSFRPTKSQCHCHTGRCSGS